MLHFVLGKEVDTGGVGCTWLEIRFEKLHPTRSHTSIAFNESCIIILSNYWCMMMIHGSKWLWFELSGPLRWRYVSTSELSPIIVAPGALNRNRVRCYPSVFAFTVGESKDFVLKRPTTTGGGATTNVMDLLPPFLSFPFFYLIFLVCFGRSYDRINGSQRYSWSNRVHPGWWSKRSLTFWHQSSLSYRIPSKG